MVSLVVILFTTYARAYQGEPVALNTPDVPMITVFTEVSVMRLPGSATFRTEIFARAIINASFIAVKAMSVRLSFLGQHTPMEP